MRPLCSASSCGRSVRKGVNVRMMHRQKTSCSSRFRKIGHGVVVGILSGLVLALSAAPAECSPGRRVSLEEAVRLALERNETLQIALEDEKRAYGAVKEAWAGALPSITLEGIYQGNFKKPAFFAPEEFGGGKFEMGEDVEVHGSLRLDQTLYAFGRVGNALKFANIYQKMATLGVGSARNQVVYSATEAYHRVLLMAEVADIQSRFLEQARSHFADVEQKFAQGTASRYELLRAEVEVKNREPGVINADNARTLSMQDLKRVLGLDEEPDPVLTTPLEFVAFGVGEEEAIFEALSSRPEMLQLELNVQGREKVLAIEKAGILPTIDFYGQVAMQGQSGRHHLTGAFYDRNRAISAFAGISLSIPIFDGFRTRGKVQQARASLRRSQFELEQARKAIRLEVTKAVQDLESLKLEHESQAATVSLAEETFAIAETRFRNGLSTQLELADAEMALDLARTNFAETLYRHNVAVANLERVLGRTSGAAEISGEE